MHSARPSFSTLYRVRVLTLLHTGCRYVLVRPPRQRLGPTPHAPGRPRVHVLNATLDSAGIPRFIPLSVGTPQLHASYVRESQSGHFIQTSVVANKLSGRDPFLDYPLLNACFWTWHDSFAITVVRLRLGTHMGQ